MIDVHCHILPGMDDGPATLEESLAMCRVAAADGIRTIVATPHHKPGLHTWTVAELNENVRILQEALSAEGLDLRIVPGSEVALNPELRSYLKDSGLTINNGPYFLIEFHPLMVPAGWESFLASFLDAGLIPVIAHPERNSWFLSNTERLAAIVRRGVLLQMTAMSITGELGPGVRDFAARLLRSRLVHMIGSDAHGVEPRPPILSRAVALVADLVGEERALAMVHDVPAAVIEGRRLPVTEPFYEPELQTSALTGWLRRLFRIGNR